LRQIANVTKRILAAFVLWLVLALVAGCVLAVVNYVRLRDAFDAEARTLHRVVSQRADQHDAHLTSLAAVLTTSDPSSSSVRSVAEAVQRFYPRIIAIETLVLAAEPQIAFTTRALESRRSDPARLAAVARGLAPGQTAVVVGEGDATY
jgi:two-component system sensor kinase FixL